MKTNWILYIILSLALLTGCTSNNKGDKVPSFTATTLDNESISTANLEGKIIVIKVWATWCGMCITEIPQLNNLVEKYKDDSEVVFIAITDDSEQKIKNFLNHKPFNYKHIVDSKNLKLLFQRGLIKEIPEHLVIDQNGYVVTDVSGEIGNIASILDNQIQKLKK